MSAPVIFPFTLYATDIHYAQSPKLAERLWQRDRNAVAPGQTYYGLDLEVHDGASVTVHVRSIHCGFSGGMGRVVFAYQPELSPADLAELRQLIVKRQTQFAIEEFQRREKQRVAAQVEAIRRELFEGVAT